MRQYCPWAAVSRVICLTACCAIIDTTSHAASWDPPAGYYVSATGTGTTLKSQLHNVIDSHSFFSYNDMRTLLQVTDGDPNDPDNIVLIYDRTSLDVSGIGSSIPGWDSGASWNREHTWPRALGVESNGPDNSDLHLLRPSDPQINADRGSLHFGGAFGAQSFGQVFDKGATVWYPGDLEAGMVARQQFYAAVRYNGGESQTSDLELANGTPNSPREGDLVRLMEWHFAVPPDAFELNRNDVIFDDYQNNRNPFVDRPEWAWSVFMDQANDSRLSIQGAPTGADGTSTFSLDHGRIFKNTDPPALQTITITKAGNDGLYFSVEASGSATSSVAGPLNAFRMGSSDSTTLEVGLTSDTTIPGAYAGTVTIDNLDVTTGGGTGRGANDANDVIDVSLTVLERASPSFLAAAQQLALSHDFGVVPLGSNGLTWDFDLFNRGNIPNFTALLELDSILASGDSGRLTTDLAPLIGSNGLGGSEGHSFMAALDTTVVGEFSAAYVLNLSEENLPGAQSFQLVLSLTGSVESSLNGDFNASGAVEFGDLNLVLFNWNSDGSQLPVEWINERPNAGSDVGSGELNAVLFNWGLGQSSSVSQPIPEPASGMLLAMAVPWVSIAASPLATRRRAGQQ